MPLSEDVKKNIQGVLDGVTSDPKNGVPGLVFAAVDKKGEYLTVNCSGTRGTDSKKPMTEDTVFWIASCTKMITALACLQLVEQGKLSLDDSSALYKIIPELESKKVLDDNGNLVDKQKEITLRMLLSHTAGFGYTFFNPKLRDYFRPAGAEELGGDFNDVLTAPLVNQPGSRWEYGTNIDWAGMAVERVSGLSLDDYFKKNIFEPLGIKDLTFWPTEDMAQNLVSNIQKYADGAIVETDHPFRRPIRVSPDQRKNILQGGGHGCFAKPTEYCKLIATLINNGVSPTTGNRILSEASVNEAFKNQIPEFPDFSRQGIAAAKPLWTNALPEIYPQEGNPPQGWGLSFHLTIEPGPTGRGRNTGWWAGIVNLFWWADREKGVGGMIAGQVLPFGDPGVLGAWGQAEAAVYAGLGSLEDKVGALKV